MLRGFFVLWTVFTQDYFYVDEALEDFCKEVLLLGWTKSSFLMSEVTSD